jgi:DNA-binding GntR family transcriptional regulator
MAHSESITTADFEADRSPEVDDVYKKIHDAVLEHRLRPGTKLAEERLAVIFGVSRARIRKALARLAHEQIVDWLPKRGAFIARPSVEQARDVFEARYAIEPAIVRRLVNSVDARGIKALRAHVAKEVAAQDAGDKRSTIRLSGEFHNLVADLAGNASLSRSLKELSALTCLVILLYDAPTSSVCRNDEHDRIVDAVERGDSAGAERLITEHLQKIEGNINLGQPDEDVDLEDIFG